MLGLNWAKLSSNRASFEYSLIYIYIFLGWGGGTGIIISVQVKLTNSTFGTKFQRLLLNVFGWGRVGWVGGSDSVNRASLSSTGNWNLTANWH